MKKSVMPEAPPDHVLRVDNDTWEKLEKHLGKKLGKAAREEITAATDQFVVAQYFRVVDNTRRRLAGSSSRPTSISRLRTHLAHVLENWGYIQNDPTTQQFFEDVSNEIGLGDVDDIMWRLRHLNARLDAYLKPPEYDPFGRYVKNLSRVYERVMGEPATITIPSGISENQTASTFVEVVETLNAALPDWAQHDNSSPSAWAQALYRARRA